MADIKQVADAADMIVNGYAFTRCTEGYRVLNLNRPDGNGSSCKSGKSEKYFGTETVCRNSRRIYGSDNHYELCYRQTGICQKSTGYSGRTCRMFPYRNYFYFCSTGYLHQFTRSDLLFTDTNWSEWKTI